MLERTNNTITPQAGLKNVFKVLGTAIVLTVVVLFLLMIFSEWGQATRVRYVKDLSNLRQIGAALYAYAEDHEGLYPTHPLDAMDDLSFSRGYRSNILNNPFQANRDSPQTTRSAEPVFRFQGYVYLNLGQHRDAWDDPGRVIQAYTAKVSPKQKKRGVLYADGHTELLEEKQLRAALPPGVDVDALDGP